jgi:hypothetical protein
MRGIKVLLGATVLLMALAMMPTAKAQISINIGGPPPVCSYGYYGYAPYACAPVGYYGPGYFYNGVFLGVGPWNEWGYRHGWGSHRFASAGGGRYRPRYRDNGYRGADRSRGGESHRTARSSGGQIRRGSPSHGNARPNNGGGHSGGHDNGGRH